MISVNNVTLILQRHTILDHITANFDAGQIHGLVGRNGSGKTMLMKCIAGFLHPTQGNITIDGQSYAGRRRFPPNMGLILENPGFLPYISGLRNLMLLAELNHKINKEQVRRTMELVGLDPDLRRPVGKYSLGMRQRLGIAQAIMEDPKLLILDEPFNGLDEQGVKDMRQVLLEFKQNNKTILLASHNTEDIALLCDHVYRMEHGTLSKSY